MTFTSRPMMAALAGAALCVLTVGSASAAAIAASASNIKSPPAIATTTTVHVQPAPLTTALAADCKAKGGTVVTAADGKQSCLVPAERKGQGVAIGRGGGAY